MAHVRNNHNAVFLTSRVGTNLRRAYVLNFLPVKAYCLHLSLILEIIQFGCNRHSRLPTSRNDTSLGLLYTSYLLERCSLRDVFIFDFILHAVILVRYQLFFIISVRLFLLF